MKAARNGDSMVSRISDDAFVNYIHEGDLILNPEGGFQENKVKYEAIVAGPLSKITTNKVKQRWGAESSESVVFYSTLSFRFQDVHDAEYFSSDKIGMSAVVDIRPKSGPNGANYGKGYVKIGFTQKQAYWLIDQAQEAHESGKDNVDIKKYVSDEQNGMVWLNVNIDDASKMQKPLSPMMITDDSVCNSEFNDLGLSLYQMLSMSEYADVYSAICIMKVGLSINVPSGGTPDQVVGKPLNISFRCKGMGLSGVTAISPPSANDDTVYFKS